MKIRSSGVLALGMAALISFSGGSALADPIELDGANGRTIAFDGIRW